MVLSICEIFSSHFLLVTHCDFAFSKSDKSYYGRIFRSVKMGGSGIGHGRGCGRGCKPKAQNTDPEAYT